MSKEATKEQILEVLGRVKEGSRNGEQIGFWAWQELIENASEIAFKHLTKIIVQEVGYTPDASELAMNLIAIAVLTRKPEDICSAREYVNTSQLSPVQEINAHLEIARITHKKRDVDPIIKAMDENKLGSYNFIMARLLFAEMGEGELDLSDCKRAATINDPYLRMKAFAAIRCLNDHYKVEMWLCDKILLDFERVSDSEILAKVLAVKTGMFESEIMFKEAQDCIKKIPDEESRIEGFARLAFFSRDVDALETAYLGAKEIAKADSERGGKIWGSLTRILAGID